MENAKNPINFVVSFDESENKVKVVVGDEDTQIAISPNMYVPLVSVLLEAGINLQKNKVVDLGLADFIEEMEKKEEE